LAIPPGLGFINMTISKDWKRLESRGDNKHFYFNENKGVWVSQRDDDWEVSSVTAKGYLQMFTGATAQECMNAVDLVKGDA
jgi:hypothetical protein